MPLWIDQGITAHHDEDNYTKIAVRHCMAGPGQAAPHVEFYIDDHVKKFEKRGRSHRLCNPVLTLRQAVILQDMLGQAIADANGTAAMMNRNDGGDGCFEIVVGDRIAARKEVYSEALLKFVEAHDSDRTDPVQLVNPLGQVIRRTEEPTLAAVELAEDAPTSAGMYKVTIDGEPVHITADWNDAKAFFDTNFDPYGDKVCVLTDPMGRAVVTGRPLRDAE